MPYKDPHTRRVAQMRYEAKRRAKASGVPFSLQKGDVEAVWPADNLCPILGIELCFGTESGHDNSPSLDRLVPELGYVPGNVTVMSARANRIKDVGTAHEHRMIAEWMDVTASARARPATAAATDEHP